MSLSIATVKGPVSLRDVPGEAGPRLPRGSGRQVRGGAIRSMPMNGRSTSGTVTEPSGRW